MKNLVIVLVLSTLTACMSFPDRSMRGVRNSIVEQLPEISLEKEFAISMGSGIFNFLDVLTIDEANISELDSVQVAVYKVLPGDGSIDLNKVSFEQSLLEKDDSLVWETIVRVRDAEEQVWVIVGMNTEKETLEAVAVFSLDKDELVLINVDGDLEEMLEFALQPASNRRHQHKAG
jgi:hypothetical protein